MIKKIQKDNDLKKTTEQSYNNNRYAFICLNF